jgi:polyphosphate kinase 2 (PPK2 family)
MKLERAVIEELMVRPAESAGLASRSTQSTTADWMGATKKKYKKVAEEDLGTFVDELTEAQSLFWANDTHALLIVLQAMDAAGKDGTRWMLSSSPRVKSSATTSCGARPRCFPNGG